MQSSSHRTSFECWQRTSDFQKGESISSELGREKGDGRFWGWVTAPWGRETRGAEVSTHGKPPHRRGQGNLGAEHSETWRQNRKFTTAIVLNGTSQPRSSSGADVCLQPARRWVRRRGPRDGASGRGLALTASQTPWGGWHSTAEADQEKCGSTRKNKGSFLQEDSALWVQELRTRERTQVKAKRELASCGLQGQRQKTGDVYDPRACNHLPAIVATVFSGARMTWLYHPEPYHPEPTPLGRPDSLQTAATVASLPELPPHTPEHLLNPSLSLAQLTKWAQMSGYFHLLVSTDVGERQKSQSGPETNVEHRVCVSKAKAKPSQKSQLQWFKFQH